MKSKNVILQLHDSAGMYGAESVVLSLGKALTNTDYKSVIGCMMRGGGAKPALGQAAELCNLQTCYFPMGGKFDLMVLKHLVRAVKEMDVKLIHCHGYKSNLFGMISAKISRTPIITTNHLFPPMPLEDRKLQIYSKIDASFTMKYLDKVVAVSEDIKTRLTGAGISENRIRVIENGIDFDTFARCNEAERIKTRGTLGVREDTIVVGTLGRLTPQKAQHVLLEALKILLEKNARLSVIIAGDGPLEGQLRANAEQLGVSHAVKFLGFRQDVVELLHAMDIFVLSSIDEGLPMALLEAMAIKTPVVATAVGDVPKVVKNMVTGILVEPGNHTVLAEGIGYLINNEQRRSEMAANAYENAKDWHSKEAMSKKYCEVYSEVLEGRRKN